MKNINISKPVSGDLESLIALPVGPQRSGSFGSSGLKGSPPVVRSTAASKGTGPTSQDSGSVADATGTGPSEPPSQGTEKAQEQTGKSSGGLADL